MHFALLFQTLSISKTNRLDGYFLSMGSQVVGTGGNDICGFSWDEGTVGVGYESSESGGVVWGNWASWGNKRCSFGGQVFGTGSECWGIWVSSPSSVCSWVSSVSSGVWVSGISASISVPSQTSISQTSISQTGIS